MREESVVEDEGARCGDTARTRDWTSRSGGCAAGGGLEDFGP
jgi:hypothetical protein